jgi:hypothetical protein
MKTITAKQTILVTYPDGHTRLTTFESFTQTVSHEEEAEQSRMIDEITTQGKTTFCSISFEAIDIIYRSQQQEEAKPPVIQMIQEINKHF